MSLRTLENTPPWNWPDEARETIFDVLSERQTDSDDRLIAAQMASEEVVMDDELADLLLSIIQDNDEPEKLRCAAAISLGPALEVGDMMGFDDADDLLLSRAQFEKIQKHFLMFYHDAEIPTKVRRKVLEAAVRAPLDWHKNATQAAYASDSEEWRLTAVFCMCYIGDFEEQILEALNSENPHIHYQAVRAAGNWEIKAAWPHVSSLLHRNEIEKPLLLAAIDAAASIRPSEAGEILSELMESNDEDVVEAVCEALAMAGMSEDLEDRLDW